jgi:TetR/AcrR family transcriptional regulator
MAAKTPVPAPEKDTDTERRILDAARIVFVRRGTAGARMQEIAEEAGVNQALLHYYFRSKERLAATIFREAASRLLPAVIGVFGSDVPLEEKIEKFVHLYIDTVRQSPFLPGYIVSEMHHHPERLTAMLEASGADRAAIVGALRRKLGDQLREREMTGAMRRIAPEQFVVNMLALVVIPFIARPALRILLGMDDATFERFLDERRAELPRLILNSLRP